MSRVRRSELAVPASSEKMSAKAPGLGADLVFLDLEDACAPSMKEAARANAVRALTEQDWGRTVRAVRVNGLDTPWCLDDLREVVLGAGDALDVLVLPKVRTGRDVWWFEVVLDQLEHRLQRRRPVGFEVLIEEAEGLANAVEIARASRRIEAVILGAGDLSASLRSRVDANFQPLGPYPGDFWHHARMQVLVAARAAGVDAIDAPFPAYQDVDGFTASATEARLLGYDGKWAIHPSQVPLANEVFSPTEDEVAWALETRALYRDAEASGTGAIAVRGQLVDAAHMRHVDTVLRRAGLDAPA